jgi:radical SAM/Cys-rich protein
MKQLSLVAERHPLASPGAQKERLRALPVVNFDDVAGEIKASTIEVLQINVGKKCNQACAHCHVDAGPDRTEMMSDEIVDACLRVVEREKIPVVDITGGAPEMHPQFERIVKTARSLGARVLDRCNLTVLTLARYRHLPQLFADHDVEVYCSLPFWEASRTDAQRGDGVYAKSLDALRMLNKVGYGTKRPLILVANPTGAFLPAAEKQLEQDFKKVLAKEGIAFTKVIALANMPIARFLAWLDASGNTERYVEKLAQAFNPAAAAGVMCRTTVSVSWTGQLYDCDFNQMLELPWPAVQP